MAKDTKTHKLNEVTLDEAHYILSEAYQELESLPEALQGIAQALDLVAHHEVRHRHECPTCQRGDFCPSVLNVRDILSKLTDALTMLSRYAELELEYIRDAVGVIGQELYGADERALREARTLSPSLPLR
ncbi:hypothetical protein [Thermosulfurimonas dismutans]|uniref:Uncharacterized protein n=1 Tax=Thermosulfurimonas dismutans TaxID=999894 RepID=A0A179D2M5_9BACT|nr:hypothetical protein [Thermosulfurimonas dismutans]OAQ20330.1 hypothetical protein TDIS_1525 [Thermosulfurimonas dismutans]